MSKLRNILAAFVAALTALAVTPAFAATVTINPQNPNAASSDPTYAAYVMMYATVGTAAEGQQPPTSYYVDKQALATALDGLTVTDSEGASHDLFTVTKAAGADTWNVTLAYEDATGEQIANALDTIKDQAEETPTVTNNQFSTSKDGYVLVESSLGTKLVADTVTTKTINEKNTYPSITKTEDVSDAEIGGTVTYTIPVVIPANVAEKDIKVVDTISKGLTLNAAITADQNVTGLSFTLTSTDETTGAKTYTATIPAATVKANAGKTITLTYTATVNENAVVNVAETNKAHLEYDNYKSVDTPKTQVKTYGFELSKVNGSNDALEGVKFTLTRTTNGTTYYYTPGTNDTDVNEARFLTTKHEVSTDKDGKITFAGLAQGTYTLTETSTLDGYKLLTSPLTVTVNADGKITVEKAEGVTDGATNATSLTVINTTGTSLPSTGGMGTTIFTVVGSVLVIGAGALLVTRRRMEK